MKNKRIAHCIHHTHWDPFWYFTAQDSMVVFAYNMKELIRSLESGETEDFYLDGQTVAIDEYLKLHPEDRKRIEQLVKDKKLIIGPFVSQLDPFISSAESVVNNLRLGVKNAEKLGACSKIAYLADPFGQIQDFPKIYNQFGINEFVFTRGMGEIYNLKNEFYFRSNDGSEVLCNVLLSGYGYGAYAFKERTLFSDKAEDYNKINVQSLIDRLIDRSSLSDEFVYPLGFDQNPLMLNIKENLEYFNTNFPDYEFKYTTWKDYFDHVRKNGKNLKVHEGEILSGQYHRIHISGMNSARQDIKNLIDEAERMLTFEVQPMMSMLDCIGIEYDRNLVDEAWYTLVNCQTHASATHIDETNAWIKHNAKISLNIAQAIKIYLMRKLSVSIEKSKCDHNLVVVNTNPKTASQVYKMNIYTKDKGFELYHKGEKIQFDVIKQTKEYTGVVRKDKTMMNEEDKWFYKTTITFNFNNFNGISYRTIDIIENDKEFNLVRNNDNGIENERYKITFSKDDGIKVLDKKLNLEHKKFVYLEDGGDEGDSYDYSYPDEGEDWIIKNYLEDFNCKTINTEHYSKMILTGMLNLPKNLAERKNKVDSTENKVMISIKIETNNPVIHFKGKVDNQAENHRLRFVIKGIHGNEYSYAGTQYSYVKRECLSPEMSIWKEQNFFEEPSSTKPLLNYVSAVNDELTTTIFTRGLKEYDFIGENCKDIAVTLMRSAGHVGLPDLNRRPGRPSGLANMVIETPELQMIGDYEFDFGLSYYKKFDNNEIANEYAIFSTNQKYYQNQSIYKLVFPISYFPINPIDNKLPENFDFLKINNSDLVFGTVKKAEDDQGYVLRMYNSSDENIAEGKFETDSSLTLNYLTNLNEDEKIVFVKSDKEITKGKLINYYFTKKKGEK